MIHIDFGHGDRSGCSGSFIMNSNQPRGGRFIWFDHHVSPGVSLRPEVGLHTRVLLGFPAPLVLHHRLEVRLDRVQGARVVDVDVAVPLGDGAAEVVEQGLTLIDGFDLATVEIRGHNSWWQWGLARGPQRLQFFRKRRRRRDGTLAQSLRCCTKDVSVVSSEGRGRPPRTHVVLTTVRGCRGRPLRGQRCGGSRRVGIRLASTPIIARGRTSAST